MSFAELVTTPSVTLAPLCRPPTVQPVPVAGAPAAVVPFSRPAEGTVLTNFVPSYTFVSFSVMVSVAFVIS